jgi:hypothetical protein
MPIKMLKLTLIKQQDLSAGGSNLVQGFYIVNKEQLEQLKGSEIKIIHIKMADGKLRPLEVSKNQDVLKKGFTCLTK